MDKETILDRLNRAYKMEEEMVGMLVSLCNPDALADFSLSEEKIQQVKNILLSIQSDTESHKKTVSQIRKAINER